MVRKIRGNILFAVLFAVFVQLISVNSYAIESKSAPLKSVPLGGGASTGGGGGSTVQPDLFTGTMSYSVPIQVPGGRKGIDPGLALTYRSTNGNGWVGVGWDLEVGAIERSAKNGVDYSNSDYVLRMSGAAIDLVNVGGNEYRAEIEGAFYRVRQLSAGWEMTDKAGVKYYFGQTSSSRQDHPVWFLAADRIYKWCLDRVEDPNGNYMTLSYEKPRLVMISPFLYDGQIYLDRIDYTGNSAQGTTNYVKFYKELRNDIEGSYVPNFMVRTAHRLKAIEVVANGNRVRVYALVYDADPNTTGSQYSNNTGRSVLYSVQQFDKNASVDEKNGEVTGGSALPPMIFNWYDHASAFSGVSLSSPGTWDVMDPATAIVTGDFNGDGKTDIAWRRSRWPGWQMAISTGGSFTGGQWSDPCLWDDMDHNTSVVTGDFNGDGKTDIAWTRSGWSGWQVALSNGKDRFTGGGWSSYAPPGSFGDMSETTSVVTGDFDGDGKTDIAWRRSGWLGWQVAISTGSGFTGGQWSDPCFWDWMDHNTSVVTGDFDGDGKTDIAWIRSGWPGWQVAISTGSGFTGGEWSSPGSFSDMSETTSIVPGDFNGDGKTDIAWRRENWPSWQVAISTGGGFTVGDWNSPGRWDLKDINTAIVTGDFNGDGKTDIAWRRVGWLGWQVNLSTGNSFSGGEWPSSANFDLMDEQGVALTGDFDGDGKSDITWRRSWWTTWETNLSTGAGGDLLSTISNGIGGTTSVTYMPSTNAAYENTQLPFPVQTLSSVTTNDGHGITSTTNYAYKYGFFHLGERDFRGFNYVKVTGPGNTINERKVVETWFHQGKDTAAGANNPYASEGYMKGKPYRTRVSDGVGNQYSETTTNYEPDASPPYFNPPQQVDSSICDYGSCGMNTTNIFSYDGYGNVAREQFKDNGTVYRTVLRTFSSNETDWIVGLPLSEAIYQGDLNGTQVSNTVFYYDGAPDCNTVSTNQMPTKGNLTMITRWFDGGTNPDVRMAYDGYGNLSCTRDSKGNMSTLSYDSTFTYPKTATNPLGHQAVTQYYGVDSVAADNGLYGQVKSVTEPNGAKAETQYDTFGRKIKTTMPDGTWQRWNYGPLGTVGSQYVQVYDNNGFYSSAYFDGLGRTFLEHKSGPGGKWISVATEYNTTGTVMRTSDPFFEGIDSGRWRTYYYDPIGRTTQVINPDGTSVSACYSLGVVVGIDADKHRKRETRDALGRLKKVEEYQGTHSSCSPDMGTPYATTRYDYDVLGNLVKVTDDAGNTTDIQYDSLGRKTSMKDPDMGVWTYQYDANSNLYKQTDAKNQTITLQYDALNRLTLKDYPTGTDVTYTYDVTPDIAIPTFPKGRRSTMTDASGTTKYFYDNMGRSTATRKTIDGSDYTVKVEYDNGRMAGITYPDNETVRYSYGTGNELNTVRNSSNYIYAYYPAADYTALGQPGTVINGNGVSTSYQYYPENHRLQNITTSYFDQQLLNLTYDYTDGGNIKSITDLDQPAITSPGESVTYAYGEKPHFVTLTTDGMTYTPDPNGNMVSDGMRTIAYNYDNMPTAVTMNGNTTSFVYDGAGARVKKVASYGPTVYIGQLYECRDNICTKYIFANGRRIAANSNGDIIYYHQDHLGSTRVVTNDTGANQESSYYYPFGATQSDIGAMSVSHKYTQQEFDAETGLYYYNARYYDPVLGRFISADTIVPNPRNPQMFNRYSYVGNNPLSYNDPSGHGYGEWISAGVGAVVGAYMAERQGGVWWKGAIVGAAAGYTGSYVGGAASSYVGSTTGSSLFASLVGGTVGGAAGGAVGGGLNARMYNQNVWQGTYHGAEYGAIGGAMFGTIAGIYGDSWSWDRVLAQGIAGGAATDVAGGNFGKGFAFSTGAALAMCGFQYMKADTDASSLTSGNHQRDSQGEVMSYGMRPCDGCSEENQNWFTHIGSGVTEGSGDPNSAFLYIGTMISKVHDYWNHWGYNDIGHFAAGSELYNTSFQAYSMIGMVPSAIYTFYAFSAVYYPQMLYGYK